MPIVFLTFFIRYNDAFQLLTQNLMKHLEFARKYPSNLLCSRVSVIRHK